MRQLSLELLGGAVHPSKSWPPSRRTIILTSAIGLSIVLIVLSVYIQPLINRTSWHHAIITTYENGGAPPQAADMGISNVPSAWYSDWAKELCGPDMDGSRALDARGCDNLFYFALPCPDFNQNGQIKENIERSGWKTKSPIDSAFKNKWIRVDYNGRSVYLQWEDVGPLAPGSEDDCDYVFGLGRPAQEKGLEDGVNQDDNPNNDVPNSALDISPQGFMYLTQQPFAKVAELGQIKTSWRFINAKDVPDGPWKKNVTDKPPKW